MPIRVSWKKRISSLRNIPPILAMVWRAGPGVVAAHMFFRLIAAVIPIVMLGITRKIIDFIYAVISHQRPLSSEFWLWVGMEFVLASLGIVLGGSLSIPKASLPSAIRITSTSKS